MRTLVLRIGRHFKRKQFFWLLFGVFATLLALHSSLAYEKTSWQVATYFQQVYEKKSLSQLDVFHNGLQTHLESYFESRLKFIWNFALDPELGSALRSGDAAGKLQKMLDRERRMNGSFETVGVLDKNGVLLAVSSDYSDAYRLVGEDLSARRSTEATLQTKDAAVVPVFQTLTGRKAIFFTAPIFDKAGEVEYVVAASETFAHFSRYLPIQSRFSLFQSLLLDDRGNMVLRDGEAMSEKTNIRDDDRLAERLLSGAETAENEEINYAGQKVFARGGKLSFNSRSHFFLISYYPVSQFEAETKQLNQEMNRLFMRLVAQSLVVFGIFIVALIVLIRRYERAFCQR